MWQCPKCGRSFANSGERHACGPAATIDEYIAGQDWKVRPLLEQVRQAMRRAAPLAKEKIAWRMPTFWQKENLIHFAAFKKHLGIFPGDMTDSPFADRLAGYIRTKGSIHFLYDQPLDLALIEDITRWRVACAKAKKK